MGKTGFNLCHQEVLVRWMRWGQGGRDLNSTSCPWQGRAGAVPLWTRVKVSVAQEHQKDPSNSLFSLSKKEGSFY